MYKLKTSKRYNKDFSKLDRYTRLMIHSWIVKHLRNCEDPRAHGKALKGDRKNDWQYRIGNYRLICEIRDKELIILALAVGHRKDIYDS